MSTDSDINVGSPTQSRGATRTIGSPWTQIVRGEPEPIASVPLSPSAVIEQATVTEEEGSDSGTGNASKRQAWNKQPSNGSAEADVGPVMGAHAWPALSETTRTSSTKSSSDSLKGLSDGSSSSASQGTVTAHATSQKQVNNNGNPNSTPSHTVPTRQRSMKRNSANSSSNGGVPQPPALQGTVVEGPVNNPSPRDHPQQRGSFRNRNGNSHPRGDGSHHHNYGGRRDHDRGNQDWNAHRNFNGRDGHMQPQRVMQRFMRHPPPPPPPPPPSSTQFIPPSPVRPFGSPIGYPELASPLYYVAGPPPDTLRGVPFVAPIPPHAVFFPALDPQLHSGIVNQIDYYFSNENLIKDTYLRQNMDDQGWVPITLIAGFKKVLLLTDNIQLILDAVRSSTVVEVQGDKIRRRNDWMRWIMPPGQFSNQQTLATNFQSLSLEQNQAAMLSRSSSGDLSAGGIGQVSIQGSSDRSISARNTN